MPKIRNDKNPTWVPDTFFKILTKGFSMSSQKYQFYLKKKYILCKNKLFGKKIKGK